MFFFPFDFLSDVGKQRLVHLLNKMPKKDLVDKQNLPYKEIAHGEKGKG